MSHGTTRRRGRPFALAAWAFFFLATGLLVASRFEITSDITHFMPGDGAQEEARLARDIAQSELSRTIIVNVRSSASDDGLDEAAELAKLVAKRLSADEELAATLTSVRSGPPEGTDQALWELYFPRRLYFVASSAGEAAARATRPAMDEAAQRLLRHLEQPMSPLYSQMAPADPLLILPGVFESLQSGNAGQVSLHDGSFVSSDGWGVVFVSTNASAFDAATQRQLQTGLERVFSDVEAAQGRAVDIEMSWPGRFSVATEETIRGDIQRVSVVSILALTLMVFLFFRSPLVLGLTLVPVVAGSLSGLTLVLLVNGAVHAVTLAFGAALIGVSVDYVIHYYVHHTVAPDPGGPAGTARELRWSLATGALTTVTGFGALATAGFDGLREVSLFAVSGVLTALLATVTLLPALTPVSSRAVPLRGRANAVMSGLLEALRANRRRVVVLPVVALLFIGLTAPRLQWSDRLTSTESLDEALLAEENRVRDRVAGFEQSQFVVAVGDTDEEALQANDAVYAALSEARRDGALEAFNNPATLLPSAQLQEEVATAFTEAPDVADNFSRAWEDAGFRVTQFEAFRDLIDRGPAVGPITTADLEDTPVYELVRASRVHIGERVGWLTMLHGVHDAAQLRASMEPIDGAWFLDRGELMRSTTDALQRRTATLLLFGLLAILGVLLLRYRAFRPAFAAYLPALLGAGTTLGALSAAGVGIDLVVLTSLLMVVSIGVDYGVFLVDAELRQDGEAGTALLGIALAACSTFMGFGLLAMSAYPLLFAIGLTAGVGVVSCLAMAPAALVLMRPGNR